MIKDPRLEKLAKTLVNYSVRLQKDENVIVRGSYKAKPLLLEIVKEVRRVGGNPIVRLMDPDISREVMLSTTDNALDLAYNWKERELNDIHASIAVYADDSDYTTIDVPMDIKLTTAKKMRPLSDIMLQKKWVLLNYPAEGAAHKAKMSFEAYSDFVIDVSNVDYSTMEEAFKPLKELMENTDKVRIVSPKTDLTFSIKGIEAIPCAGEYNIPDGEIFTAPVKDSVNGVITYNTPSPQRGTVFNGVSLTFKDGKIVDIQADNDVDKLNDIFDTDEGARYVGEFAIGVNPLITKPMGDILFDEKIGGSLHFTPGNAYPEAFNGNKSAIHWDLVLIQTPEFGGGEIYFDDVLIRKDGLFVLDSLKGLNPENLK